MPSHTLSGFLLRHGPTASKVYVTIVYTNLQEQFGKAFQPKHLVPLGKASSTAPGNDAALRSAYRRLQYSD